MEQLYRQNSLVLYKNRPAIIRHIADKFEIELEDGKSLKVRAKDITLLHPGPVASLSELRPQIGEVETAWELLIGAATTLPELAELIYESYTPATAWSTWALIEDGLYFQGTPEAVTVRSPEQVEETKAARQAKLEEEKRWAAFIARAQANRIMPEDQRYLAEVEMLALGKNPKSRVMRELGYQETPETAHALLLRLNYWDHTIAPYPQRLGLAVTPLLIELPELPDETRLDLTQLPAFAIDDEGSQDPDDALSIEGNRLWVHIADVAALVQPDSPVDLEARARGANLYLPEQTIPMLPQSATQKLGLGLQDVSPALSFGLDLGPDGQVKDIEIVPSWVRVTRLSYEQVERQLNEAPFDHLYGLARTLQERRQANGGIFIDLPEVKIRVQDGQVIIRPILRLKSRDLVQEAMLITGEALARFALAEGIALPFTTQDAPEIEDLPEMESLAGMFAWRRALKRSQLTTAPGPHAGLGLEIYAKATSPLRRYSDLVVHQQLRAHIIGREKLNTPDIVERIGESEAIAGSVAQAERLARKHWTLVYLMQNPDWAGKGVLVDKRSGLRGLILIPELDLEAQVHLSEDLALNSLIPVVLRQVALAQLEANFRTQ